MVSAAARPGARFEARLVDRRVRFTHAGRAAPAWARYPSPTALALADAVELDVDGTSPEDAVFGGPTPRRPGARWAVDPARSLTAQEHEWIAAAAAELRAAAEAEGSGAEELRQAARGSLTPIEHHVRPAF